MTPDPVYQQIIARLFDSGHKLVYEFTGAGSLALAWLHSMGGSSRLLLEASDRYSSDSLTDLIGRAPAKPVSGDTAALMAQRAYRRAVRLSDGNTPCIGLACTATIATDRMKRGEHACHIAVQTRAGRSNYAIVLAKGARDRVGEETAIARLMLHALAETCGIASPPLQWMKGEVLAHGHEAAPDPIDALLNHRVQTATVHPGGRVAGDEPFTGALLSGSFNPLHCGHETMLRVAGQFLGLRTAYELPIVNADKPPLLPNEIERRASQFKRTPVILTRVALFHEKAPLFPGCTFVVGFDTAVRLVDPRYYDGPAGCAEAFSTLRVSNCRFLVAARSMPDGVRTLADVSIPQGFEDLFVELPRSEFLVDLSSTQLRST